jgi:hypothetical protein
MVSLLDEARPVAVDTRSGPHGSAAPPDTAGGAE